MEDRRVARGQAALLRASAAIVRRRGLGAVTMRAVAARAGVSGPAAYHHFKDKRELLAAAAAGFRALGAERALGQLAEVLPRARQVVDQSRTRVLRGVTDSAGKLISVHEPWAQILRRGKRHAAGRGRAS